MDAPADYADFYVVLALYGEYVANQLRDSVRGTVHGISLPLAASANSLGP
ncbi:hypothetical protein [Vulcanisaeta sp. JCM 14467]|nr:hypothetical protein [Vulcanisaeta sp. JCM 14467]